ncbi:MAG: helix-turn-helix transcriptional regulator [Deltaproteobacteria bacterium]|nr:helix-turn-helix transcriptional regulator [Deltaproteobacteria bacterium]
MRLKKGMTIEKLAWENDMSKGNLSEIEKGMRNIRYLTLKKLASGLNVCVRDLVDGD